MKIIGKSHHAWPKGRYSRQRRYYHLHGFFMSWTHKFRLQQSSIVHFAIVTNDGVFWLSIVTSPQLICDVTWTPGTSIVTSYSSIVLARADWRKRDLYWWITTVNINYSPLGIHALSCKKTGFIVIILRKLIMICSWNLQNVSFYKVLILRLYNPKQIYNECYWPCLSMRNALAILEV